MAASLRPWRRYTSPRYSWACGKSGASSRVFWSWRTAAGSRPARPRASPSPALTGRLNGSSSSARVPRVLGHGALEVRQGLLEALLRPLVPEEAAAQVVVVGLRRSRVGAGEPLELPGRHDRPDLPRDRRRELALEREEVPRVALVMAGPEVAVGRRVHELRGDPHAPGAPRDRALDDAVDTQLARDLGQWLAAALVAHHGLARDHPHGPDGSEVRA